LHQQAARRQEEWQAQLEAQQAALEENQTLLRATQEEVKAMNNKFVSQFDATIFAEISQRLR